MIHAYRAPRARSTWDRHSTARCNHASSDPDQIAVARRFVAGTRLPPNQPAQYMATRLHSCGYPLATGVSHLTYRFPAYAAIAERGKGWADHVLAAITFWYGRSATPPAIANAVHELAKSALAAGKGAVSLAATLATRFTLASLLLLEGPELSRLRYLFFTPCSRIMS